MSKQGVGSPALGAAVCRAIEQYEPKATRLFNDPVVGGLVGGLTQVILQSAGMRAFTIQQTDAVAQGIYGAQICRTRFIDEAVQAALAEGVGQLVILGAGLDTRPYRLPGLDQVRVLEVDLPAVQADKKKKLQKLLGRLPGHVTFLSIDFDTQTLEAVFAGTAFDSSRPAMFVWEGVTQYLSEAAVRQTLAFVGKMAPGSRLVFTYILKSILERRSGMPDADNILARVASRSPWIFGLDPAGLQAYLQPFHLALLADVGNADYQANYLRPLKRRLTVFEGERAAEARVEGA